MYIAKKSDSDHDVSDKTPSNLHLIVPCAINVTPLTSLAVLYATEIQLFADKSRYNDMIRLVDYICDEECCLPPDVVSEVVSVLVSSGKLARWPFVEYNMICRAVSCTTLPLTRKLVLSFNALRLISIPRVLANVLSLQTHSAGILTYLCI